MRIMLIMLYLQIWFYIKTIYGKNNNAIFNEYQYYQLDTIKNLENENIKVDMNKLIEGGGMGRDRKSGTIFISCRT